jgi:hypothetical protein
MDDKMFTDRFEADYRAKYQVLPKAFTALDFVGALGSIHGALLYSRLFLPRFVEVDGFVFLQDVVADEGGEGGIRKLIQDCGDGYEVEKSLNSFDLTLNLPNHLLENAAGDDLLLAEQLATLWLLRLQSLYPAKDFFVGVFSDDGETGVFFHQQNPATHP